MQALSHNDFMTLYQIAGKYPFFLASDKHCVLIPAAIRFLRPNFLYKASIFMVSKYVFYVFSQYVNQVFVILRYLRILKT